MARKTTLLIAISLISSLFSPAIGRSFVLPASQIIEFMTKRFEGLKALRITQLTIVKDMDQDMERALGEIIEVVSPDAYRSEVVGQPGTRLTIQSGSRTLRIVDNRLASESEGNDFLYRFLLLDQTPARVQSKLRSMGINIDKVSLTRLDGTVAYVIGEKEGDNPRLIVDKERFLPLLLRYGNASFRFSDYNEIMEGTWYPYHIVFSSYGNIVEEYMAKEITANPPVDITQFSIPLIKSQFRE